MKTLSEIIALAPETYPKNACGLLDETIYTRPLTPEEQGQIKDLLSFARELQLQNASFESVYHQLLHLYVLNGSRLEHLRAVDRRLRGLADGQGALILIEGVSGIGKTTLVMAFQERIARLGAKLISGRCSEQHAGAYALWQRVVRSAAAAGFPQETLPVPLGKGEEARSSQHLIQALGDWLRSCASSQPLVILLDDLHWAEADSLEILNALTQQAPAPILYIATYRNEETHHNHAFYDALTHLQRNRAFDHLRLDPLTRGDVERFATAYHGDCTPELISYLYERAEGHPLFTIGLLDDLAAEDLLPQDAEGRLLPPLHAVPVPGMLNQLITRRVSRLGDQVERLLSTGAVTGESWSLKIVEPLLGIAEDDLLDAVERALQADLIRVEDSRAEVYTFSHGLIREVLYNNQLARRRRQLHQLLAAEYERQEPDNVFARAYHDLEGGQWARAVESCREAGEQAARRYASFSALEWYQRALDAAGYAKYDVDSSQLFDTYDRLGRTLMALNRREEAEIVTSQARDLAQMSGNLLAEGTALVNLSVVRMRQYQLELAEKTAFEALRIAEKIGDPR